MFFDLVSKSRSGSNFGGKGQRSRLRPSMWCSDRFLGSAQLVKAIILKYGTKHDHYQELKICLCACYQVAFVDSLQRWAVPDGPGSDSDSDSTLAF